MGAPPRYVVLDPDGLPTPPPGRRNIPRYHEHDHHHSSGYGCMKCFCCCCCFIFFVILLICATLGFLVFFLNPQLPVYTVDNVSVTKFDTQHGNKVYTELNVVLKAQNPNEEISLGYGEKSSVIILYSNNQLCSGQIPSFQQPPKNTSMMNVELKGESDFDSQTQQDLLQDQKENKIPLDVKVNVPLTIVTHGTRLKEIPVVIKFKLTVDNLQPGQKINAVSSDFQYGGGEE
ncbi:NDR1/HIN1-like protein 6 [Neltuma alba]|uniref:NDR1/HIN1-like protein 6 n=1 Tax=Neltuma alba TaxID=207710 RepID=UPI0010A513E3|nr:NDR1/HIN1-like protein 6 [Prosopis alba]